VRALNHSEDVSYAVIRWETPLQA